MKMQRICGAGVCSTQKLEKESQNKRQINAKTVDVATML